MKIIYLQKIYDAAENDEGAALTELLDQVSMSILKENSALVADYDFPEWCRDWVSELYSDLLDGLPCFIRSAVDWAEVAAELRNAFHVITLDGRDYVLTP